MEFIKSQKLLKREDKTASKVLDGCAKAYAPLEEGTKISLGAEAKTEGIEAHV